MTTAAHGATHDVGGKITPKNVGKGSPDYCPNLLGRYSIAKVLLRELKPLHPAFSRF
jgi:hypothetical protein